MKKHLSPALFLNTRKNLFFSNIITFVTIALLLAASSCDKQKDLSQDLTNGSDKESIAATSAVTPPYINVFEGKVDNHDGTWTYTWSMQNLSPYSNNNPTGSQDLSHWDMFLGACVKIEDIISGAQGTDLNALTPFTPTLEVDNSLINTGCPLLDSAVLKFSLGTSNNSTAKVYYTLTIRKNVGSADVTGYFKSGRVTGCGTFTLRGLGCEEPIVEGTSLSQGFYFAKPNYIWVENAIVGGHSYTQAEGKAIWNTSNKGGLATSKSCFTQLVALYLSRATVGTTSSVNADQAIAEAYLNGKPKITTLNYNDKTIFPDNEAAKTTAGNIGAWINAHHTDNTFGL